MKVCYDEMESRSLLSDKSSLSWPIGLETHTQPLGSQTRCNICTYLEPKQKELV